MLLHDRHGDPRGAWIEDLWVAPPHRRRGVASRLMDVAEALAAQ